MSACLPSSGTAATARSSLRNIRSVSSPTASVPSSSVPNAAARSAWPGGGAAPSRRASPEKSPPASAARRSGLAYRSRTLVAASVQPSVASRRYLDRIARPGGEPPRLAVRAPAGRPPPRRRAEAVERGADLEVRVGPGGEPAEDLEDGLLAEDQAGVGLLAGEDEAVQARLELGALDLPQLQRAEVGVGR